MEELNKFFTLDNGNTVLLSEISAIVRNEDSCHIKEWGLYLKNGKRIAISYSDYVSLMTYISLEADVITDKQ